jgi:hypothetical protein
MPAPASIPAGQARMRKLHPAGSTRSSPGGVRRAGSRRASRPRRATTSRGWRRRRRGSGGGPAGGLRTALPRCHLGPPRDGRGRRPAAVRRARCRKGSRSRGEPSGAGPRAELAAERAGLHCRLPGVYLGHRPVATELATCTPGASGIDGPPTGRSSAPAPHALREVYLRHRKPFPPQSARTHREIPRSSQRQIKPPEPAPARGVAARASLPARPEGRHRV